ncbi:MAG: hypothetical protein ACYCUG_12840, partial [Acidimicrobiales bacterium]
VSLTLRMLEYQIGGERSRLVTDLTDPDTYPARDPEGVNDFETLELRIYCSDFSLGDGCAGGLCWSRAAGFPLVAKTAPG